MGIIVSISNSYKFFSSNVFIVVQNHRTIKNYISLSLHFLNFLYYKYHQYFSFFHKSSLIAKIDLSKAYYHIYIHKDLKKYITLAFTK